MSGMLPTAPAEGRDPSAAKRQTLRWVDLPVETLVVKKFQQSLGISPILARLLGRLGLADVAAAQKFLHPKLSFLEDPFLLTHLKEAVLRIEEALVKKERIVVLGDYDVDGITATTLLVSFLRRLGCSPDYIVPRRMEEGYGLSHAIVDRALGEYNPDLFIALDCGTNAVEEVAKLRGQGVDVLILDHHRSKSALPEEAILINPHVFDDPSSPWLNLSAVGLVFKLIHGLSKHLKGQGHPLIDEVQLKDYLDLVAMGTIADLVPLAGENRIFARHGLKKLSLSVHTGVRALFQATGLELGQEVHPVDVSFKLGPRINASGRLADARLPLEMLLTSDFERAYGAAHELNLLNRQRQEIERQIAEEAEALVLADQLQAPAIVVYSPEWHSGVVGIVAGRLARRFFRPSIVLGADGPWAKGSGRSIPGVNLVEALNESAAILRSWGGHPMAVGVSLDPAYVAQLRAAFCKAVLDQLRGECPEATLEIAAWLTPSELSVHLLGELDLLRPFGEGNPEPVLGIRGAYLKHPPTPFGDNHYRFQVETQKGAIAGVAWNKADQLPPFGRPIDLAVKFGWNIWNGRKSPQLELLSFQHT